MPQGDSRFHDARMSLVHGYRLVSHHRQGRRSIIQLDADGPRCWVGWQNGHVGNKGFSDVGDGRPRTWRGGWG